jgi:hypothetical protein
VLYVICVVFTSVEIFVETRDVTSTSYIHFGGIININVEEKKIDFIRDFIHI